MIAKSILAGCSALALSLLGVTAWATPTFVIAPGACNMNPAACIATNGLVTVTALPPQLVSPTGQPLRVYASAFTAWNATQPVGAKWTLDNLLKPTGPLSDAAVLTVKSYFAVIGAGPCNGSPHCGGASIDITYTPGVTDPPPIVNPAAIGANNGVWTQDIITSFKGQPSNPGNPYLDNPAGSPNVDLPPPAFGFQYPGSLFADLSVRDADNFWHGVAWLSTIDYATRDVRLYSGVAWGYTIVGQGGAPEPATWTMLILGVGLAGAMARRRSSGCPACGDVLNPPSDPAPSAPP